MENCYSREEGGRGVRFVQDQDREKAFQKITEITGRWENILFLEVKNTFVFSSFLLPNSLGWTQETQQFI